MGQATTAFDEYDYFSAVSIEVGDQCIRHDATAKSGFQFTTEIKREKRSVPIAECNVVGPLPNGFCYSFPA